MKALRITNLPFTIYHLRFIVLIALFAFIFQACEQEYTPKPRGFQRIELPKKEYKSFESDCGFTFNIPVYSHQLEPRGLRYVCRWFMREFYRY